MDYKLLTFCFALVIGSLAVSEGCQAPAARPAAIDALPWSVGIETVNHDGHRWVLTTYRGHSAQLLHHPDCPCGKVKSP